MTYSICVIQAHHKGKYLLEHVCKQLNLIEQDYLGLRYVDAMEQRVIISYVYYFIIMLINYFVIVALVRYG